MLSKALPLPPVLEKCVFRTESEAFCTKYTLLNLWGGSGTDEERKFHSP